METNNGLNYDMPVEIADGVYWIGFYDRERNLHCNPYLIIDGDEAAVIDGGSRTDFSTVMTKILQAGAEPSKITALIYHHYDPDLCSSIPNFEDIIDKRNLQLISQSENNVFIRYYSVKSKMVCIDAIGCEYMFSSGRRLRFVRTPYSHSAGSFVTFDEKTGILFSSDIFGSYDKKWDLYIDFAGSCSDCSAADKELGKCPDGKVYCPLAGIYRFHRRIMTSCKALRYAIHSIRHLPITKIAPQHGSIIHAQTDIDLVMDKLEALGRIGIDGVE